MKASELAAQLDHLRDVMAKLGDADPEVRMYTTDGLHFEERGILCLSYSGNTMWIEAEELERGVPASGEGR